MIGTDALAKTTLFKILAGELEPDEGSFKWGVTTSVSYLPTDNGPYFDNCDYDLLDWIRAYSDLIYESDIRSWLGRMLFSGEEATKKQSPFRRRTRPLYALQDDAFRRERSVA